MEWQDRPMCPFRDCTYNPSQCLLNKSFKMHENVLYDLHGAVRMSDIAMSAIGVSDITVSDIGVCQILQCQIFI